MRGVHALCDEFESEKFKILSLCFTTYSVCIRPTFGYEQNGDRQSMVGE